MRIIYSELAARVLVLVRLIESIFKTAEQRDIMYSTTLLGSCTIQIRREIGHCVDRMNE